MHLRTSATLSATYAGTGRCLIADEMYGEVSAWASLPTREQLREHEMFARFSDVIAHAPIVTEPVLACFRGRNPPFGEPPRVENTPTSKEMGPPQPQNKCAGGRYNALGEAVLYLCDCEDGVARELTDQTKALWVQAFQILTAGVRIADFHTSSIDQSPLVSKVFWFAELAGAEGYPSTIFSQIVAEVVSSKFHGMYISGVHGDLGQHYGNVVIFKPENVWRNWLMPKSPFLLRRENRTAIVA